MRDDWKAPTFGIGFLCLGAVLSCSTDARDSRDQPVDEEVQRMAEAADELETNFTSLQDLVEAWGEEEGKAQMAARMEASPDVAWTEVTSQGVMVQYESGLGVAYVLDTESGQGQAPDLEDYWDLAKAAPHAPPGRTTLQADKIKSLVSNPLLMAAHYSEFKNNFDPLISQANAGFAHLGIASFKQYLDQQCVLERYRQLDGHGIIHLAGHGIMRKKAKTGPQEVYLMTGHPITSRDSARQVLQKYKAEVKSRDLIICVTEENGVKAVECAIAPDFVTAGLSLWEESPLVWLGFCYSGRGTWQDKLISNAGASACLFWDNPAYGWLDADKAGQMYEQMSDTTWWTPVTVGFWFDNTTKSFDYLLGGSYHLGFRGTPNLAFWVKEEDAPDPIDLSGYNFCVLQVVVTASLNDSDQGNVKQVESYAWASEGSFSGRTFSGSWDEPGDLILGLPGSKGNLQITLDSTGWNVINFNATETEATRTEYDGYHFTTTQTVQGSDLALTGSQAPLNYYFGDFNRDIKEVVQSLEYHTETQYAGEVVSTRQLLDYDCSINCFITCEFRKN